MKKLKKILNNIREVEILNFGYNNWNGFYFTFIGLQIENEKGFEGDLLGLYIASDVILFHILYIEIQFRK